VRPSAATNGIESFRSNSCISALESSRNPDKSSPAKKVRTTKSGKSQNPALKKSASSKALAPKAKEKLEEDKDGLSHLY